MTTFARTEAFPMAPRHSRLQVEELSARTLPSVSSLAPTALTTFHPGHHQTLDGEGFGIYTTDLIQSGAGKAYHLQGFANLDGLGRVAVSGDVHAVGFIQNGHAGGELTFTNQRGSVTIELEGPAQPGFSPLPKSFTYHVASTTGAFRNLSDHGTLQLNVSAVIAGNGHPHGFFTLFI